MQPALVAQYAEIERYYARRIEAHGPTPQGVDWSCRPTQELRFVQLLKVCDFTRVFSLNDLGCGYGALKTFIRQRWPKASVDYLGTDLAPGMVEQARALHRTMSKTAFEVGAGCLRVADYTVASGIFNVRLDLDDSAWTALIESTLADMHAHSRLGFAVNFLRSLPGIDGAVPELYRAHPSRWRAHCEDVLGVQVDVIDQYGMREFTLLARQLPPRSNAAVAAGPAVSAARARRPAPRSR